MTIYEKLAKARVKFQSENVKKSGKNKFAGYDYYELSDILPVVNKICEELKILPVCCFGETATMTVYDCESEQSIVFTSPMAKADLKGCHEVQNLGAAETYLRRYLYQNAFEIVEHDVLDESMNPEEGAKKQDAKNRQGSQRQMTVQQAKAFRVQKGKYKDYTLAEYLVADEGEFYQIMNFEKTPPELSEMMRLVWEDAHGKVTA